MSSVSSVRIPGLATGLDTDTLIKDMLTGEQSKIDKVNQSQQIVKWKQDIYRDTIKDIKGLYDKYFSATSKDYILGSSAFNTMIVNSSNKNVITATGSTGANDINYRFEVEEVAQPPKLTSEGVTLTKDTKLSDLGLSGDVSFRISTGDGKESKVITIKASSTDAEGNPIAGDTIESLVKKINDASSGEIKASFSEMTGQFSIQSTTTGKSSELKIIEAETAEGKSPNPSDALSFLFAKNSANGSDSRVNVYDPSGTEPIKTIESEKNSFTIDGVTYSVNGIGSADLTSTTDVSSTVDKMQNFINDYNKIMDNIYDLVTEKKSRDYPPLTDAQREEMTEEEIEKWEKKAKQGILRNDSELRAFMDDMTNALGFDLAQFGIKSSEDYNKKGQLYLDVDKFTKALKEDGENAYKTITSTFDKVKDVTHKYVGTSSSILVKKAGMEKTSTAINNLYSEQIRKQEERVKTLLNKMKKREEELYKKFAKLEANMNTLNSQMNYFMQ